jgi:hypothetical protein
MNRAPGKPSFVGREIEKRELIEFLDLAKAGTGGLILIAGEPGIGKSRLTEEAISAASSRGFEVVRGACWEAGGAPPYWPWIQISRHCGERKSGKLEKFSIQNTALEPWTEATRDVLDASTGAVEPLHDRGDQFLFFDSFAEAIREFAGTAGLLIVLEDLHAADPDSVLLAQFIARRIGQSPILLIGTYREREVHADGSLEALILELSRAGRIIRLRGFERDDIKALARQYDKSWIDDQTIEELHRTTEGNPFFLIEILAFLRRADRSLRLKYGSGVPQLPDSVRVAIESRLSHLPSAAVQILQASSVVGREFDVGLLSTICEKDRDAILSELHFAERWGIVSRFGGPSDRYLFSHFLLTQVLYEQLPLGQRESLHHLIAETVESQGGLPAPDSVLAHHYFRSLPRSPEKAFHYSLQSGDLAMRSFAYTEAARLYEMALTAQNATAHTDKSVACSLLLKLGKTQCLSHEFDTFKQTFLKAAALAREIGNPVFLADAALGFGMAGKKDFDAQEFTTTSLLREALDAGASLTSAKRSLLLSRLAEELRWSTDQDSLLRIVEDAVEMARRSDDSNSLMQALYIKFQCLRGWPERSDDRLALAAEMVENAERSNLHEWLFRARYHRASILLESGKRQFYSEISAIRQIPEAIRLFTEGLSFGEVCDALRVTIALMDGRFDESEKLLNQGLIRGRDRPDFAAAYFAGFFGLQIILLRREQGKTADLEQSLRQAASEPSNFVARAALAHFYAESGNLSEAASNFDILATNNFEGLARDFSWSISVAYLVETCAAIHDVARARILFDLIKPCAGRHAVLGVVVYLGSFDYYLGLLAATFKDAVASKEYFLFAREAHKSFNSRPWIARTELHLGQLLISGSQQDQATGAELLSSALKAAESMCMSKLERECREAIASLENRGSESSPQRPAELDRTCSIIRENDYWRLTYEGNSTALRNRKGLTYLIHLLRNPGGEFASTQLASARINGDGTLSIILQLTNGDHRLAGSATLGDAGEILDSTAREEYKNRINELRSEIDQAQRFNDIGQVGVLQTELELLEDQIRGAFGLGGRSRRVGSHDERARVKITNSIRSAIDAIDVINPQLGRYLKNTVKTGAFCSYRPDPNVAIEWSF